MVQAGPRSPGAASSGPGVAPTVAWTNPSNALTSNDQYAEAVLAAGVVTRYLQLTSFGFSIPTDSKILGIELTLERTATGGGVRDDRISVLKATTGESPVNRARTDIDWTATGADTQAEGGGRYGGVGDLWGYEWTAAEINATGFGFVVAARNNGTASCTAQVDHALVTVYYEEPARVTGAGTRGRQVLQLGQMRARHVKLGSAADFGARAALGVYWTPQDEHGINGDHGFQAGEYTRKLNEEGGFSLRFPNAAGDDGANHRDRFALLTDSAYEPGDEWLEIYREGDLLYVGTPTRWRLAAELGLEGYDAVWMLKKQRETSCGWWCHAPRDVFEHYTRRWKFPVASDFEDAATNFPYFNDNTTRQSLDGLFNYKRASGGVDADGQAGGGSGSAVTLRAVRGSTEGNAQTTKGLINSVETFQLGTGSSDRTQAFRAECTFVRSANMSAASHAAIGLWDTALSNAKGLWILIKGDGTVLCELYDDTAAGWDFSKTVAGRAGVGPHHIAFEIRDRWCWFMFNGDVVAVLPAPEGVWDAHVFADMVAVNATGAGSTEELMTVESFVVRQTKNFLMPNDPGSYRLAPDLTPGGLIGTYFSDADLPTTGVRVHEMLSPIREPYGRRLDPQINFTNGNTWPRVEGVGTPSDERLSVRWVGAIYLDLATTDKFLSVEIDDRARVWVGKTRVGEEYISDWNTAGQAPTVRPGGSLRQHLGTQEAGWYPIKIEFSNSAGVGGQCILRRGDTVNAISTVVPSSALAPLGIYENHVRSESFYETVRQVADDFGIQFVVEPRQLESGEFPGRVVPKPRVGRDTEKVLTWEDTVNLGVEGNAEDRADVLSADAQGIADPKSQAQLMAEALRFDRLLNQAFVPQEHENESDISHPQLLKRRLDSKLALRSSPWEDVGGRPFEPLRELLDSFPLQGDLAEFGWLPGDGLRVRMPVIAVEDATPRQLTLVTWPFVPGGLHAPNVGFRQRPRNVREALRKIQRQAIAPQRNYQGQLVAVTGSLGANPTSANIPDSLSRVSLPHDLSRVIKAEVVVMAKSDTSVRNIGINGTNRLTADRVGRYDVTEWVAAQAGTQRMYVEPGAGTGTFEVQLELLVRV